jgi:hypothetical protein
VDYAGAFPPASLSAREALQNYQEYRRGPYAWMLGRLVVRRPDLELSAGVPLSLVSDSDDRRPEVIESTSFVKTEKPFYWETEDLEAVRRTKVFGKFRAKPEMEALAGFIERAGQLRIPFKLTAGLHRALGTEAAHGFVNAFLAAAFACFEQPVVIGDVLAETDAKAFHFDDCAHWREHSLSSEQISIARREFAHSFGSCSFIEPIESLQALGWLPD